MISRKPVLKRSSADFTDAEYRQRIREIGARWPLGFFPQFRKKGRLCLVRHDVDFSLHRALQMARIENEEGVRSTFFLFLHSPGYNLLEEGMARIVKDIEDLGHHFGLHFDPSRNAREGADSLILLEKRVQFEKRILEKSFGISLEAVSFHNPDVAGWQNLSDRLGGLVNCYGPAISKDFSYLSDSNGHWRFKTLGEVVMESPPRLHLLIHPEWWTPNALSPRDRILRCVSGRGQKVIRTYDAFLSKHNRKNIGKTE